MSKPIILVIDVDASTRRLLVRNLVKQFRVDCVDDIETALAAIDAGATYDAVLCELQLPGMSGHQLRHELLRRCGPLARRLVITGSAGPARHETMLPMHVAPLRARALSIDEIQAALRAAIGPIASLPPPATQALAA